MENEVGEEYDFGLAFSYNYIMTFLKREHPELDLKKLEIGVKKYIEEHNQGNAS